MTRRFLAFLLFLAVLAALLTSCGVEGAAESSTDPVKQDTSESTEQDPTESVQQDTIKPEETEAIEPEIQDQIENKYETPTFVNAVKAPQAGDNPLSLSGVENVLRIGYVLQHAENYSMDGRGTVKTKVAFISYTQNVETYKDYKEGVLLQTDVTDSSIVNGAWQTCFVGDVALLREAAGGKKTWDGRNTAWKDGEPEIFSRAEYRKEYGLFGFELSNYILNKDTIDKCSAVTDAGDGTYTLTIYPNLTAATADAIRRMKKMGELEKDPVFKEASITLTFDREWRLLLMHIEEVYSVKVGIINSDNCRASTDYTYSYGTANVSDFDDYFARYLEE